MPTVSSEIKKTASDPAEIIQLFPNKPRPGSRAKTLEGAIEIVTDNYVTREYKPSGTYVITEGTRHHIFLDHGYVQEFLPLIYGGGKASEVDISQYSMLSKSATLFVEPSPGSCSEKCRSDLRSGGITLPLKKPYDITKPSFVRYFDIPFAADLDKNIIQRKAIRKYIKFETKAAQGTLSDQEMTIWKRMCNVVDRRKAILLREQAKPQRALGEVITLDTGQRTVKWVSGSILPLSGKALQAIDILNTGEWFEADIIQDQDGSIMELRNIDFRDDYRLATDDEVNDFFFRQT